ncbi:hypothetical protein [Bradyrhizobium guangdongense]|uniref:DUF1877 domain-containing protein n=2 Tax=Bradyrhizobium guangdongense TaxID=1325090 RepID=A0AA87W9Q6_9BRAD|nr:hypothetical protein [Bradyrhizobium guangdongense]GGI29840.1 hypothetical protein GCM10010987_56470 [Bradyrhizobium guangdongense]
MRQVELISSNHYRRMGIDIYAQWEGMTEADRAAQVTGFSIEHGHVGYLREAYHGDPYATVELVNEAFVNGQAYIPAATLRDRLPQVLRLAEKREREIYEVTDADEIEVVLKSFRDFVAFCARKESETGKPCLIIASY